MRDVSTEFILSSAKGLDMTETQSDFDVETVRLGSGQPVER
jgi:hypothetical protein